MWTLQAVDPPDQGLLFRILPGTLKKMGRAPRADSIVDAALVSRVHCRWVLSDEDALTVEDLGSTNGTLVNGNPVKKHFLQNNDVFELGKYKLKFIQEAGAQPAAAAADSKRGTTSAYGGEDRPRAPPAPAQFRRDRSICVRGTLLLGSGRAPVSADLS